MNKENRYKFSKLSSFLSESVISFYIQDVFTFPNHTELVALASLGAATGRRRSPIGPQATVPTIPSRTCQRPWGGEWARWMDIMGNHEKAFHINFCSHCHLCVFLYTNARYTHPSDWILSSPHAQLVPSVRAIYTECMSFENFLEYLNEI